MSEQSENWKEQAAREVTRERDLLLERRKALIEEHRKQMRLIEDKISDLNISARALGLPVDWSSEGRVNITEPVNITLPGLSLRAEATAHKPFKERTRELLEEAYPAPMKAAQIRQKIESEQGIKYHQKTAGMSLYRLSQDGIVQRKGTDWYLIPPEQRLVHEDKENPEEGDEPNPSGQSVFD